MRLYAEETAPLAAEAAAGSASALMAVEAVAERSDRLAIAIAKARTGEAAGRGGEGDEEEEGAIVPIYSKVGNIPPKALRKLVSTALEVLSQAPDPLPEDLRARLGAQDEARVRFAGCAVAANLVRLLYLRLSELFAANVSHELIIAVHGRVFALSRQP